MIDLLCVCRCRLPYYGIFGGVTGFLPRHFELVNGFSNQYYGWGGEDDDMFSRSGGLLAPPIYSLTFSVIINVRCLSMCKYVTVPLLVILLPLLPLMLSLLQLSLLLFPLLQLLIQF